MKNRFVVAIGSSAGGLEPMSSFFDFTPHDQATYIILRHIPFNVQSQLHLVLQRHSRLSIVEAENQMPIERDFVYMPPPAMLMTIANDILYLHKREAHSMFPNRVIDVFLTSLAKAKGPNSIAIILSGHGNDGLQGAKDIKEAGGMVIVQSLESCHSKSMPENIIEEGIADHILLPHEMPAVVLQYANPALKNANESHNLREAGRRNTPE